MTNDALTIPGSIHADRRGAHAARVHSAPARCRSVSSARTRARYRENDDPVNSFGEPPNDAGQRPALPFRTTPSRIKLALLLWSLVIGHWSFAASPGDYGELTRDVKTTSAGKGSVPGQVASIGRLAFPVASDSNGAVTIAASYFGDVANSGRVIAYSHTGLLGTGTVDMGAFAGNVARWCGRSVKPVIAFVPGTPERDWKRLGIETRNVQLPLTAESLRGMSAVMLTLHNASVASSMDVLREFARDGGGVILASTPWAAKREQLDAANDFLESAGLAFHTGYAKGDDYRISTSPPSPLRSAMNGIDALLKMNGGGQSLSRDNQLIAAQAIELALAARPNAKALSDGLAQLNKAHGWIQASKAQPLRKDQRPIDAMLARYQANLFDSLPAKELFKHPGADDWPGAVSADAQPVSRTLTVNAVTPAERLINHGQQGRKVNTGVYAPPGKTVTIRIPERAKAAGLSAIIGVHTDSTFHLKRWNRFPKISREWNLATTENQVGGVFGGLVILRVPPNCKLGEIEVTIEGGVPAPVFVYGETTNAEWNAGLKNAPGAWGYIESEGFCSYVRREALQKLNDPESVARYWQRVISTADKYLGYSHWRRHGEAGYTDRDISAGYGHAGYPVVMAYGDGDALVKGGPAKGDWGFLHEIGHTFQDSFDGNYTIATHAEVDVNLVPGLTKMLVHDVTCIDNNSHPTFNAKTRLAAVQLFQARPANEQTWDIACKSPAAYDFYFTLAECFGWELYQRAFGRLMNFLQNPAKEPELQALNQRSPNNKRDRFFLLFCQESGRNLLPHFQKYGLGKSQFGLSADVIAKVARLPEWKGNQPLKMTGAPPGVELSANAGPGTLVHRFAANDPDAGTIFTWTVDGGNEDGAFAINRRTGALTVGNSAALKPGTRSLTVSVSDSTVPASTDSVKIEVRVK